MIVFDTDVFSELMRREPNAGLLGRLAETPASAQTTTAITIGEVAYGARRVRRPELFGRAMALVEGIRILDFDRGAAEHYGRIRADLEQKGTRLADPDLRIAATALAHRGTLITGNVRHLGRVAGLRVEDWLRG